MTNKTGKAEALIKHRTGTTIQRRDFYEWRQYYNEMRPHSALQWATPAEFAPWARENALSDRPTKPEFSTLDRCGFWDRIKFISRVMDKWAYERGIELDFSRPGKPTDNARVESFNGRFRQECLNAHWFLSLEDARRKIDEWRQYYNEVRPHSALQWATPAEFARQARENTLSGRPKEPEFSILDRY